MIGDRVTPSGKVSVEIIRANGNVEHLEGSNAIHQDIRNKLAASLASGTTNICCIANPAFDSNAFQTPTNGQSGIYIVLTNGTKYEMLSTKTSTDSNGTAKTFTVTGVLRSEATYAIASGVLGNVYSTSSGAFTTITSTHAFSGGISLVDGDQLTVTWTITIADN
mgnify:CR=1 FL=1|tara:strand:- start:2389 stop:2883 length:495 start_codon:yes stop_codon:yes gene_type:complete